jgi:hypothetical protein
MCARAAPRAVRRSVMAAPRILVPIVQVRILAAERRWAPLEPAPLSTGPTRHWRELDATDAVSPTTSPVSRPPVSRPPVSSSRAKTAKPVTPQKNEAAANRGCRGSTGHALAQPLAQQVPQRTGTGLIQTDHAAAHGVRVQDDGPSAPAYQQVGVTHGAMVEFTGRGDYPAAPPGRRAADTRLRPIVAGGGINRRRSCRRSCVHSQSLPRRLFLKGHFWQPGTRA